MILQVGSTKTSGKPSKPRIPRGQWHDMPLILSHDKKHPRKLRQPSAIEALGKASVFFFNGVFPKIVGKPPKWMVYFMENPY